MSLNKQSGGDLKVTVSLYDGGKLIGGLGTGVRKGSE